MSRKILHGVPVRRLRLTVPDGFKPVRTPLTYLSFLLSGTLLTAGAAFAADLGLGVNVSFSPAQVPVNTASTMTVTLQHNNNQAISNIAFSQSLGGLAAGAITSTCGGTASVSSGNLVVTGSTLPAATTLASCTITLPVQAATAATYPVAFTAGSVTGTAADNTPARTLQDSSATLTVANYIPIGTELRYWSQTYSSYTNEVRGLDPMWYEIWLTNRNAVNLANAAFTASVHGRHKIVTDRQPTTTCSGGSVSVLTAGQAGTFRLTGATIPANPADMATGGSCVVRIPVEAAYTDCRANSDGVSLAANIITSTPQVGNQGSSISTLTATGVCISKGTVGTPVANGGNGSFSIIVNNRNAIPLTSVSLTDPMPRGIDGADSNGAPAGVIATNIVAWPVGSASACNFGALQVDTATNTASIAGAMVPDRSACEWRVNFKGWNDGPANHSNTDGTKPIDRTNVIPASNIALQTAQGPMVYPVDVKALVTINPPIGDLGVTKQFLGIPGMFGGQAGTVELKINLQNNSPIDALVVDALEDDLDTMYRNVGVPEKGYSFVAGTMSFSPGCGAGAATLSAGSQGSVNARLTATPGTIVIPVGQTCTITNRVYVSGALGSAPRINTIGLNTVKAHYQTLPLNTATNTSPVIGAHYATQAIQIGKSFSSPLKTLAGVPAILAGIPGSRALLTITITGRSNKNMVELGDVRFADKFPATPWAMKLAADAQSTFTSTCGGSIAWDNATDTLQFSGGTLPAGDGVNVPQCIVQIPVIASAGSAGVVTNQLGVRSAQDLNAPNGVQSIITGNFDAIPTDKADLAAIDGVPAFAKSFSKTQVNVGEETTLKIELVNSGQTLFALNGVSFADQLPTGMEFKAGAVPQLSGDASCLAGTAAINGATLNVSFPNGPLNITKQPCTATVPVIARAAGNLINTIAAGALKSTENVSNPQLAEATVTAIGQADLFTQKTNDAPGTGLKAGDNVVYDLVAGNLGPDAAAGATVTDMPPPGLTITGWTCTPATPADSCPPSGVGSPVNVPVTVSRNSGVLFKISAVIDESAEDALTNTATVTAPASVTDPNPGNNTSTSKVELMVDMAATWGNVPTVLAPGSVTSGLELTCDNLGATMAAGATCTPQVTAGTISNLMCQLRSTSAAVVLPTTIGKGDAVVCTMDYKASGTSGGTPGMEPSVTFTGITGATRDSNPANDQDIAAADIIDAVNDALGSIPATGGNTPSVLDNDRLGTHIATPENVMVTAYGSASCTPAVPGATCSALMVNSDGTITVPAKATPGNYQVPYQICVSPATTPPACDTAVASVTVEKALPTTIAPVPAMDRWALILLGLALAIFAMAGLRKRLY